MKRLSYELAEEYIGGDSFEGEAEDIGVASEASRELGKLLMAMLDEGLTKRQKQCLLMYYREGLTVTEIAQLLKVSPSTVSRTVTRARKNLAGQVSREALRRIIAARGGKK